jgi:uncharacterized membrane protein
VELAADRGAADLDAPKEVTSSGAVSADADRAAVRFEPLHPVARRRLIAAIALGPLLWLIALSVVVWVLHISWVIEFGVAVTAASLVVSALILALLRRRRVREERRYEAGG